MKDSQNNDIKIGVAYQYAFAWPGPDVSCVIVNRINDDGTVDAYDVLFQHDICLKGKELSRPIIHSWDSWGYLRDAVIKHGGMLDLSVDAAPQQEA